MYTYTIKKANKDRNLTVIEKGGITGEFTLQDIYDHQKYLADQKKQLQAHVDFKGKIVEAYSKNSQYAWLNQEFTKQEVEDFVKYFSDLQTVLEAKAKIKEINKQEKEYEKELKVIKEAIGYEA